MPNHQRNIKATSSSACRPSGGAKTLARRELPASGEQIQSKGETMNRKTTALVGALMLGLAACGGGANPILGKWVQRGEGGCSAPPRWN
jgi:hypothetical protein